MLWWVMSTLEKAIEIALKAHYGVTDKAGAPYLLHPLRMMFHMPDDECRIAAVLHDVVEDSPVTIEDLRKAGFSETILGAVNGLTRREDESYDEFIKRAGKNHIARTVKLADLKDNLRPLAA